MTKRRRRWGRIVLALIVVAAAIYGGVIAFNSLTSAKHVGAPAGTAPTASRAIDDARAPLGVRIKVEVLNSTTIKGLARRGTLFLRDRGFDVVGTGTSRPSRDSTLVLDRSGHPEWARLVARALNARMESRPDSSRYLDVTVLLGGDWRPPALPFHP